PARFVTSTALAAAVLLIAAGAASAAPPTCTAPPTQSVISGDQLFFNPFDVCSDPDPADALDFAVTTPAQHGNAVLDSGAVVSTPRAGYRGPAWFAFRAPDGTDTTAPVTVAITVEPNQPPQCPATLELEVEPDVPTAFDPYFDCTDDQFFFLFNIVDP